MISEFLPTLRELANQPALWSLFALAASVYFWSLRKDRQVRKFRRDQRGYELHKKRLAMQWELDLAKKEGWQEVWKEDSGRNDEEYHYQTQGWVNLPKP